MKLRVKKRVVSGLVLCLGMGVFAASPMAAQTANSNRATEIQELKSELKRIEARLDALETAAELDVLTDGWLGRWRAEHAAATQDPP